MANVLLDGKAIVEPPISLNIYRLGLRHFIQDEKKEADNLLAEYLHKCL